MNRILLALSLVLLTSTQAEAQGWNGGAYYGCNNALPFPSVSPQLVFPVSAPPPVFPAPLTPVIPPLPPIPVVGPGNLMFQGIAPAGTCGYRGFYGRY